MDALVRLLTDPHRHVRRSAVISLGQLGPGAAAADKKAVWTTSVCERQRRYHDRWKLARHAGTASGARAGRAEDLATYTTSSGSSGGCA